MGIHLHAAWEYVRGLRAQVQDLQKFAHGAVIHQKVQAVMRTGCVCTLLLHCCLYNAAICCKLREVVIRCRSNAPRHVASAKHVWAAAEMLAVSNAALRRLQAGSAADRSCSHVATKLHTFTNAFHTNRLASLGIKVIPVSPDLLRVTSLYSCTETECRWCSAGRPRPATATIAGHAAAVGPDLQQSLPGCGHPHCKLQHATARNAGAVALSCFCCSADQL